MKTSTASPHSEAVHFLSLHLRDYGIFRGNHTFHFNRHRTAIVSDRGAGKTTAAQALVRMGVVKGVTANVEGECPDMRVKVETAGNRQFIRKFRMIIYLSCESAEELARTRESAYPRLLNPSLRRKVDAETKVVFHRLLARKYTGAYAEKTVDAGNMAAGERICLGYAFAFAVRKVLGLILPVVFDSPYGTLDASLRDGLQAFLRSEPIQQIIFGSEWELRDEGEPHYFIKPLPGERLA